MTWVIMPTFNERANVETIVPAIRSTPRSAPRRARAPTTAEASIMPRM